MYWNRKHVLVCTAQHCMEKGALNVAGRLRIAMRRSGLDADVLVNTCDSIDLCDCGPNMIVYPDKVIYSGVQTKDIKEIMAHFEGGEPVERLVLSPDSPEEVARKDFYQMVVDAGWKIPADQFASIAETFGFDTAWINEQARRGFIARKEVDGTPTVNPTTKALSRYRIDFEPPEAE
jgi:(2Fe-2S) ferredoxin